jgi:xylan 1,4-beta-xylosidase
MRLSRVRCFTVFVLLVFCSTVVLAGTALATGGPRDVKVNASKTVGVIRSLQGAHWDPGPAGSARSEMYKDLGIDSIRTHDAGGIGSAGVGDTDGFNAIDSIFPDFSKDPADPASYNFGPTDQLIKNISDAGAEVYFRVGRSNRAGLVFFPVPGWENAYVPDIDKFAEVVRHIVLHYNKGWAGGYHYGIRYWEIWNEPDFKPFWNGTPEQYHELYAKTALAIRSVDARAKIGGPANTTHNDMTGLEESFLSFVRDNRLPLDFYSYHLYANNSVNPYDNARFAQKYRDMLDSYGFKQAQVVNSEYGTALDDTQMIGGPIAEAVFTAEAQIYMQSGPLDRVYSYMMIPDAATKENHAFAMVSKLNRTPQRLRTSGDDDTGFAVLAGRNEGKRQLRVLVANYQISPSYMGPIEPSNDEVLGFTPFPGAPFFYLGTMTSLDRWLPTGFQYQDTNGYRLEVTNIPRGWGDLTVKQYRIDTDNDMTLVGKTTYLKRDRAGDAITVSGSWVHAAPVLVPDTSGSRDARYWGYDPEGVAQGIDMIVISGSTGSK